MPRKVQEKRQKNLRILLNGRNQPPNNNWSSANRRNKPVRIWRVDFPSSISSKNSTQKTHALQRASLHILCIPNLLCCRISTSASHPQTRWIQRSKLLRNSRTCSSCRIIRNQRLLLVRQRVQPGHHSRRSRTHQNVRPKSRRQPINSSIPRHVCSTSRTTLHRSSLSCSPSANVSQRSNVQQHGIPSHLQLNLCIAISNYSIIRSQRNTLEMVRRMETKKQKIHAPIHRTIAIITCSMDDILHASTGIVGSV